MEISRYEQRGVSPSKPDVEKAAAVLDPGLYPGAFCRIYPDDFAGDPDYCSIMHSDGAGSEAIVAYLEWKESGNPNVWAGIAQDSLVMNLDDMACAGATGPFVVNMTIGRNKRLIHGSVVEILLAAGQRLCSSISDLGFPCRFAGGETADLGDQIRTITVDHTAVVRFPRKNVIDAGRISAPALIVGFSSTGQAIWEDAPNSGIGSNGFTNARHDALASYYRMYPETFDPAVNPALTYCGSHGLYDSLPDDSRFSVGSALLSPTRTYLPLIADIVREIGASHIMGFIHCSGGGQTKIGKFGQPGIVYVKDDLFPIPPVFQMLRVPKMPFREMYEVYNMGHRLEAVVTDHVVADACIDIAARCGIEAKVIGRVVLNGESRRRRRVIIRTEGREFSWAF